MPAKFTSENYLYTSARIRSFESGLLGADRIRTLSGTGSTAEMLATLVTYGYESVTDAAGRQDAEAMFTGALRRGMKNLGELPDKALTCLVQYPYDCHNIKACLKAPYRGIDPAELLVDAGSVPAAEVAAAMKNGDYAGLPPKMAAAIPEATAAFRQTGDPREIDFCLDRAAFADMDSALADFSFGRAVLTIRIDTANLQMAIRLSRGGNKDLQSALFGRAKLEGGSLDEGVFDAIFKGEGPLHDILAGTPYAALLGDDPAPALFERRAEDMQMGKVREAHYITYGPEIAFAYLFALDTEVKNLRIILAGKEAGLPAEAILERVRESYV